SPLQRLVYESARTALQTHAFVKTRAGWHRPSNTAWAADLGIGQVILEADLPAILGRSASYVSSRVLNPASTESASRAAGVLNDLGANLISIRHLIKLLA